MAYDFKEAVFDALGGLNTTDNAADIPQDPKEAVYFAQANNVYAPGDRYDLMTRPGMTDVRSTAINASGIFTSLHHQGDIADRQLMTVSIAAGSHNIYQDSANPPAAIAGGTNFTIGQDNLVSAINFHDGTNPGTILMSLLRDTPQFVTGAPARSDFSITGTILPAFGEVFGQRALYGAPSVGGTVFDNRVYWSDIRDGNLLTDTTTQFESFETEQGDRVRGIRKLSDICLVGKLNNVFVLAVTQAFAKPYAVRELPAGRGRGPAGHHAITEIDGMLLWRGQNGIYGLDLTGKVTDWADELRGTFQAINDDSTASARIQYTVAGTDSKRNLALFAMSGAGETKNQTVVAVNTKTKMKYIWTLSVNAMGQRNVSGDQRLLLGGYVGLFRNFGSGSTGNLDDATALIDADVFTPRHHVGSPTYVKLWGGVKVLFDPQGSEAVTVQYRLNDDTSWTSFAESPYTVSGTDKNLKYFPLMKAGTHVQLRFRNANSGEVMRIQRYSLLYRLAHPALVN